jgi:hypothetical protein
MFYKNQEPFLPFASTWVHPFFYFFFTVTPTIYKINVRENRKDNPEKQAQDTKQRRIKKKQKKPHNTEN